MSTTASQTNARLPRTIRPLRYDLTLAPDLDDATFDGSVSIRAHVEEPTDDIVLHSLDLEILAAQVRTGLPDDPVMFFATVTPDVENETATLHLECELEPGPIEIVLQFRGILNDQLVGFYRSTFTREDPNTGELIEHTLAVTQFESTHARRAFPCFDEPDMKAIFSVTLVVDPDLFVVSNTAEIDRSADPADESGRVKVRFADTIVMSTYLLAFVVGPMEATEVREVQGRDGVIPLRVVHPPGSAHLCDFALDVADHALRYFEHYYDIPYPGDKVDLVAVPDFAFGAMENLGCVTFREVLLLIDPANATPLELQRVADVINHELAHMWFGDLVTMSWWNGIWLNEAFATFMEIMASDAFRPEWDVWTTFGLARAAAFDTDSLHSTRPIEYEVITAADAEGMFDILTYEKGASVVRMLEQYLGAETFRKGISTYLRRHEYGNTETSDLWDALEEVSGEPVRHIMDNWIFRGGYPLVEVTATSDGLTLTQSRAVYAPAGDGTQGTAPAEDTGDRAVPDEDPWPVPMVLAASDDPVAPGVPDRLLFEQPTDVKLDGPAKLVQANVGSAGFYRVHLDSGLRDALIDAPNTTPMERFSVLDDTWWTFLAGRLELSDALAAVARAARRESTDHEPTPAVWRSIAAICRRLVRLTPIEARDRTRQFVRNISLGPLASLDEVVEFEPSDSDLDLRGVLFGLAGAVGASGDVHARALEIFGQDPMPGDAALRAAAVDVVAAYADHSQYQRLLELWRSAPTPQDEIRLLYSLVDPLDAHMFERSLELSLTEVRTQNAPYLLARALGHETLAATAWEFVEANWDEMLSTFPTSSIPRMLEGVRGITDEPLAQRVADFLGSHPVPAGEMVVTQHLERMGVSVAAARRVESAVTRDPDVFDPA